MRRRAGGVVFVALFLAAAAGCGGLRVAGLERPTGQHGPFPPPAAGHVMDLAGLLAEPEKQQAEQWLELVEASSGIRMLVVTIHSMRDFPGAPTGDIAAFSTAMLKAYGLDQTPRRDGLLLLVAVKDKMAGVKLGPGYAAAREAAVTRIVHTALLPPLRRGEHGRAILGTVRALARELAGVELRPSSGGGQSNG